jgi:phosphoribosyl-AMP cyclohydrolase
MNFCSGGIFHPFCCQSATIAAFADIGIFRITAMSDTPLSPEQREQGATFAPIFDAAGLLTAVVVDARSHAVLVVAHMNREALEATLATGNVTFWSRSRARLWMKGETSGNVLKVAEVLVDCDQDALVIRAHPAGPTCHTGATSCFYRRLETAADGTVALVKIAALP